MAKKKNKENEIELVMQDTNSLNVEDKDIKKQKSEVSSEKIKKQKVKILIALIIIVIIIDVASLIYYFKPFSNLSNFNSSETDSLENYNLSRCEDGTPEESCSKEKPYFCYKGQLLKKAYTCGCPLGYKVNFQDCKKI